MNEVLIALALPAVMLAAYLVFAPIEFGASVLRQFPSLLRKPSHLHDALSPIWKVSNVFLIFALTGMAFFFADAIPIASNFMLLPFVAAMLAFLIRTTIYLYLFFAKDDSTTPFLTTLFTMSNFAVPLFFGIVVAYLMSGKAEWLTLSSLAISCLIIGALLLGVSTFYLRYQSERQNTALQHLADGAFLFYTASIGILLPWVAKVEMPHIYDSKALLALFGVILLTSAAWLFLRTKRLHAYMWALANIYMIAAFTCLLFAQWPWLIYSQLTFEQAFTGGAFVMHIVVGLGISLLLIAPGFILLYKLMKEAPPSKPNSLEMAGIQQKNKKEGE